ncbi:hypothetical protein BFP72_06010 [Reichenbachiella sp. 5M10]|uniref:hypothetical protein n=1 Tax=Reichenbachiella sp. 5M10 TaxID=1889772 RepID=UPI000C1467E9|nr:hypothetical protein [Reichenbachiella sp. 5M10]PIB34977.1 hypothetical protein BFP72_06010 [Reichenbachiella sp. 5M10]
MEVIKLEIILSGVLSIMVTLVAYFLRQLIADFRKVESDLTQVKNTTEIIRTESKGMTDLIHQRIDFLERRVNRIENQTFNES